MFKNIIAQKVTLVNSFDRICRLLQARTSQFVGNDSIPQILSKKTGKFILGGYLMNTMKKQLEALMRLGTAEQESERQAAKAQVLEML